MPAISRVPRSLFLRAILIAFLAATLLCVAGAGVRATSQLSVRVPEAAELEFTGSNVIVKVRLDRGVTAQLWSGVDCGVSARQGTILSANGTYTFPKASVASSEDAVACLATSDQRVRAQVSLR